MTQREQTHLFEHVVRAEEYDPCEAFEHYFWTLYPKKVGKLAAKREWDKLKPSKALCEQIQAALAWQVAQHDWTKDNGQWVPEPRKWLHHGKWMDERRARPRSGHWSDACPHSPTCTRYDWCELLTAKERIAKGEL